MTLEQLLVFITTVQTLNFSEAARRLQLSQPAVSQHIKALEKSLDVILFERSYRQMQLTTAGETLYPYALRIRQELDAARFAVNELQGKITGLLRIGASTTNGNYLIPQLLVQFKQRYPDIQIRMIIENGANLQTELAKGNLDLLLLEGPQPQMDKHYWVSPFYDDQLVVIKNPHFQLKAPLTPQALAQYPWIMREPGSGTREILLQNLQAHGVTLTHLNVHMEVGTIESVKQALQKANALSYLSKLAVEKEVQLGELEIVDIAGLNITRPLWLISPVPAYQNAAMKAFILSLSNL